MDVFLHIFLHLPAFLRDLAYSIVALWVFFIVKMMWQAYRVQKANKAILKILLSVPEATGEERADGMPLERISALRSAMQESNDHARRWWDMVEGALLPYIAHDGTERWYISDSARELFDQEVLFEDYSEGSHQAVPGLLTALGLLGTFFALLIGLADLRYTDNSRRLIESVLER